MAFLSRMHAKGVSGAVARNRVSALAFNFKLRSWTDSTKHFLVGQLLKGWRRKDSHSDNRRPISFQLLASLIKATRVICDSTYETALISAAFGVAFFGAMRVSEILPSALNKADGLRPSVWFVGHSYIYWAARRAELCPGGRSLGFTDLDVIWRGTRGLIWSQVLPEVGRIARGASSPTVVVIHAGGNDLASFPLAELLTLMRSDMDKFPSFFSAMRIVLSEVIPRLVWWGARELNAMERSRRTLNQ
ncbi:unnamed protein product [Ranitomeya imitator]|uniref:Uncharacterized protein n=1 Tax=Ranitomeya imitator TaxID=111125 RepID=A0ABN9M6C8_9NEOB|nr:unnamed protein product [Ranitomeya imitator]